MRPLVMGILNVTPDSFSDGGRYADTDQAISRGLEMLAEGADLVDVGGESSRPGATAVPEPEERRRVVEVVAALSKDVRVSVDTVKPGVASACIEAGASLLNDISASRVLAAMAAEAGIGWVAMHMQGTPATMQRDPRYGDVVAEVRQMLGARAEMAAELGVKEIWVDPGIGFGKTDRHNLALLANLDGLVADGVPVMVGVSRKRLSGVLSAVGDRLPPPEDRSEASLALAALCMASGVAMVRTHDVAATVQAACLVGEGLAG